jgi:hypothetical protein
MFLALKVNLLESWICYRYKSDFINFQALLTNAFAHRAFCRDLVEPY